jgi:recombination protein RecA
MASELNVIQKSGTWYTYGDERLGQGRDNARVTLEQRPEMYKEIMNKVLELKGIHVPGGAAADKALPAASSAKPEAEAPMKASAPQATVAKPAKNGKH